MHCLFIGWDNAGFFFEIGTKKQTSVIPLEMGRFPAKTECFKGVFGYQAVLW